MPIRTGWDRRLSRLTVPLVLIVLSALAPQLALAAGPPPHIATDEDTDVCAMCHRAHTSGSETRYRTSFDASTTANALVVGLAQNGDVDFCYTCHAVDAVGSNTEVQSAFLATSRHSLDPSASAYGPTPKQCSDCHDSHGTARTAGGDPYPGLLRSVGASGAVYSGEEYCAACHRPGSSSGWSGLDVFRRTAHYSALPTPSAGTGIRCTICHASHGSEVAPLIQTTLTPPAAPATTAITADDRSLCFACHPGGSGTYAGQSAYQQSSHALSSKAVSISAEWASATATRTVGECQVCHAPMGMTDGAGGAIAKLARKAGPGLCLTCHTAAGPAEADLAALTYPATAAPLPELLASWTPPTSTAEYSRLAVYGEDAGAAVPRPLVGPREYRVAGESVGPLSVGDIDGDGLTDVVVATPGVAKLAVFSQDALRGLTTAHGPGVLAISSAADLIAVGDFLGDGGFKQVAVVDRSAAELSLYRYNGSSLARIAGPLTVGSGASSIAIGDVTGTAPPDIVVAATDSDRLDVFTASGGTLVSGGTIATRSKPTGLSIGDVWPGGSKSEIVVLNSGESTGQVSIFNGSGSALQDCDITGPAGAVPTASAIGDILTAVGAGSGSEVVVAVATPTGNSALDVFVQDAGGLDTPPQDYVTGARYNTGSLAVGDVDGDGRHEVVAGNAGRWVVDTERQLPSLQVFRATGDGTALDSAATQMLPAGGVEIAGAAPSLVVADLGEIGPSRHPWGAVAGAHVSTETPPFTRHVECSDCHEVHEATSTPAAAPNAYGRIKGAWGVSVTNDSTTSVSYVERRGIRYEYELCFKCHSGWAGPLQGRADVGFEFNPLNPSVHAVEQTATTSEANADSFVAGWDSDSVLYCTDCHADRDSSTAVGPHTSPDAPILERPYLGVSPTDSQGLCYKCHRYDVYDLGTADAGSSASLFRTSGGQTLHSVHTGTWGLGCDTCHVSHGSTIQPHLIRATLGFAHSSGGGSCTNACHPGVGSSYSR